MSGRIACVLLVGFVNATVDMETAAIGREASARGLPYIAFRAGSDGAGDPLGLPGFPAQFYAYYRLAARNAAIATIAFLERLEGEARHASAGPTGRTPGEDR